MIQRFNEQVFQRMSPERRARKLSVMKALAKSVRSKNKENEDPLNNNMALPYFSHSTPLKNQQVTDLDVIEPETEVDADLPEELDPDPRPWTADDEPQLVISKVYDLRDEGGAGPPRDEPPDTGVTVLALQDLHDDDDKHWRSLEVLHENAEYEFCRSLEESKLFVSTSSLLEEIEADLPSPYSLAKPLNHTFHTLTSYRTQTRLARMEGNATCPESLRQRESLNAGAQSRVEYLEVEARVQKALAEQSEKALQLSKAQKMFGVEHVESEKALLLANLRCSAAVQEAKKLRLLGEVGERENVGQVSIWNISFEVSFPDSRSNCPEKYICTATERESVQATSIADEAADGKLRFGDSLRFKNLHKDFVIYLELFKLINREPKRTLLTTALMRKLRKMTTVNFNRSLTVAPYSLCGFVSIGQWELRLKDVMGREEGRCTLQNCLTGVQRPLAGAEVSLLVETDVHIESKQRGFLNVFKQTWHRRWFSLSGYFLESWLYPEDRESDKAPVDSVYLPSCSSVEPVGIEVCIRPHSFVITLKEGAGEVLFSASSQKDMLTWVEQLNATLEYIRLWKSDV